MARVTQGAVASVVKKTNGSNGGGVREIKAATAGRKKRRILIRKS